jgi:hypothetical protein
MLGGDQYHPMNDSKAVVTLKGCLVVGRSLGSFDKCPLSISEQGVRVQYTPAYLICKGFFRFHTAKGRCGDLSATDSLHMLHL